MVKKTPRGTWAVVDPKINKVFGIYRTKEKALAAQQTMRYFNPDMDRHVRSG